MSAFLDALEARLAKHPSEALAMWLEWAREYVEGFNPLSSTRRLGDLTAHAAILATPKVGEPDPDEEEWRQMGRRAAPTARTR
jgi:hypothetical protein